MATTASLFLAHTFPPKLKDLQVNSSLPKRSIILGQNCDVDGSLAKLVATVSKHSFSLSLMLHKIIEHSLNVERERERERERE